MARHDTLRITIHRDEELKGLRLDQKVTVIIKGTVKMLEAPRMMDDFEVGTGTKKKNKKWPGEAMIEISKLKIEGPNEFSDLMDDDED